MLVNVEWKSPDVFPADKEWVLVEEEDGSLKTFQWQDDGKGWDFGTYEITVPFPSLERPMKLDMPFECHPKRWMSLTSIFQDDVCTEEPVKCSACGGELKFTGGVLTSLPAQYDYVCTKCGHHAYLSEDAHFNMPASSKEQPITPL